jgi:hypothetical protein
MADLGAECGLGRLEQRNGASARLHSKRCGLKTDNSLQPTCASQSQCPQLTQFMSVSTWQAKLQLHEAHVIVNRR